jgi:hypothetical protein
MIADRSGVCEPFREQHVDDREKEHRVRAGHDRQVLVGLFGRLRTAWVDNHNLPAPLAKRAHAAGEVGRGHQAAVRLERVRTHDHQVVAAVDVGHGHRQRRAEHQAGRNLLRHLVDRARAVDVARPRGLQHHPAVDQWAEVVRRRIAEIHRDRVVAVRGAHFTESAIDLGKRFVPADFDEFTVALHERSAQAIGIRFKMLQRSALRAQEAVTEHVILVPADQRDFVVLHMEFEPAGGFTQVARAIRNRLRHPPRLRL